MTHSRGTVSNHHIFLSPSLDVELRRFWEIEEIPRPAISTPQDEQFEEHFRKHPMGGI